MFAGCTSLTQAPEIKTYTPNIHAYDSMLNMYTFDTGYCGQLTTCIWNDLSLSEVENIILYEMIFGYNNQGDGVRISITCKDGSGIAYYDSESLSWVFEY